MFLHALPISVQSAIDITNLIIAEKGFRKPSIYWEIFEILYEEKLISKKVSDELSDLAGLMNILVHSYWRFDLDTINEILHQDLGILKEFMGVIKRL